jgi:hypothetical protein
MKPLEKILGTIAAFPGQPQTSKSELALLVAAPIVTFTTGRPSHTQQLGGCSRESMA